LEKNRQLTDPFVETEGAQERMSIVSRQIMEEHDNRAITNRAHLEVAIVVRWTDELPGLMVVMTNDLGLFGERRSANTALDRRENCRILS
jgi:hypothetical protein